MTLPSAAALAQAPAAPRPRVLFVDDEPAVLEALALNLRRTFDVVTATSGDTGLEHLTAESDFAVVVSDMRMPRMDGATFLAHARELAPDVVRILLTGHTDLEGTIKAVNHGQIFRFLTKPCPRDTLRTAIESAVAQHKLITGERVLLEQTLRGSVRMLVDILALAHPAAFGRANQIKTRVLQLASLLGVLDSWELEIAGLASQLGAIVLPHELCDKLESKQPLSDVELVMASRAPELTEQLLANLPRLETVRQILALHVLPPARKTGADARTQRIELGAHLLRVAIDIEQMLPAQLDADGSPVAALRARGAMYDAEVLEAVERMYREPVQRRVTRAVSARALRVGMVLAEDVRLASGTLLVARGYEVTPSFIARIANFPPGAFDGEFTIEAPP